MSGFCRSSITFRGPLSAKPSVPRMGCGTFFDSPPFGCCKNRIGSKPNTHMIKISPACGKLLNLLPRDGWKVSLYYSIKKQLQHLKDILQGYNCMNQKCEHFKDVDEGNTSPNTKGCEECEKEKSDWVALRMCLVCGHVGCCDSSIGLHARKHFENTGHPVMIALPNKPWRWCYEHKQYY